MGLPKYNDIKEWITKYQQQACHSYIFKNAKKYTNNHHTFYMLNKNHRTSILDKKSKLMKNKFIFMGIYLTEENVIMNIKCIVPWNKKKKQ